MDIQNVERTVLGQRIFAGDFEAVFTRIRNKPQELFSLNNGESIIGYYNPLVADLVDKFELAVAPEKQDQISRELMDIIREDHPVTFLYPDIKAIVAHRRIRGLKSPFWSDPILNIDFIWIEEEE